jgi:hypothetical protein
MTEFYEEHLKTFRERKAVAISRHQPVNTDETREEQEEQEMTTESLAQVKMGTEALALCIAGVLCERDPSLLQGFREMVDLLYSVLDSRGDQEAAAMVAAFGRALINPAFKARSN